MQNCQELWEKLSNTPDLWQRVPAGEAQQCRTWAENSRRMLRTEFPSCGSRQSSPLLTRSGSGLQFRGNPCNTEKEGYRSRTSVEVQQPSFKVEIENNAGLLHEVFSPIQVVRKGSPAQLLHSGLQAGAGILINPQQELQRRARGARMVPGESSSCHNNTSAVRISRRTCGSVTAAQGADAAV